ncbi:hypothetical protein ACFORG_01585 [Lutimaribacter marinistellae]|uniref:Enolase C-terminal domain-like n=1 Tax=Lutimaribacter marinistellae TaxID=1820329 RepID=A0ABV7TAY0_9RHOB
MKIEAVDVVQMRNVPVPRRGKKKLPVPEQGFSTVVQITASSQGGKRHVGLGEIRAMSFLTGETPIAAFNFARRLGQALVGKVIPTDLDGEAATEASARIVTDATKEILGISEEDALADTMRPAVRFGFDCAILDCIAREAGKSVTALLGGSNEPVRRNVFSRSYAKPSILLNKLLRGNMPNGWLRGSYAKDGATLASVVGAIAAATSGRGDDLQGVWFDLNNRWKPQDAMMMLEGLEGTPVLKASGVKILLEQPFHSYATAWYKDLFARLDELEARDRVHIMIEDGLTSAEALDPMKSLMPHVDLKVTPQKCGSLFGMMKMIERARELGFDGRIYLGNAGMNTELNSLMLVSVAQILGGNLLFSADYKREDGSKIRQVWPQVEADEIDRNILRLPEGDGWAAQLCQSGLQKRLRKCDFMRSSSVVPDVESLKTLLLMRAFDDSTLDVRQIEEDSDEEETDTFYEANLSDDADTDGDPDTDEDVETDAEGDIETSSGDKTTA